MPFPPDHYQEVSTPRHRDRRERWVVALGGLLAALLIAVTLISLTSSEGKSGHGCLNFTYAMVMGGERLHACGAEARKLCAPAAVVRRPPLRWSRQRPQGEAQGRLPRRRTAVRHERLSERDRACRRVGQPVYPNVETSRGNPGPSDMVRVRGFHEAASVSPAERPSHRPPRG